METRFVVRTVPYITILMSTTIVKQEKRKHKAKEIGMASCLPPFSQSQMLLFSLKPDFSSFTLPEIHHAHGNGTAAVIVIGNHHSVIPAFVVFLLDNHVCRFQVIFDGPADIVVDVLIGAMDTNRSYSIQAA